jgi:tetratricopeptide (TPR) repeat protein
MMLPIGENVMHLLRDAIDWLWNAIAVVSTWASGPTIKYLIALAGTFVAVVGALYLFFEIYERVWITPRRDAEAAARRDEREKRDARHTQQLGEVHTQIQQMSKLLAAMQAAQSAVPVSVEVEARAAQQIAQAATDIAGASDERSQRAFELFKLGDANGAVKLLNEVLETKALEGAAANKEAARAARNIAAFTRLQNASQAADLYERATRLDPDNADALLGLATLSQDLGRPKEAQDAFERLLVLSQRQSNPQYELWALIGLGDVQRAQGNLDEAADFFGRALAMAAERSAAEPANADGQRDLAAAHERLGVILSAQGKFDDALRSNNAAIALMRRLAEADPDNKEWQYALGIATERIGNVLVAKGKFAAALQHYEERKVITSRLADAEPGQPRWWRDLSVAHNKIGSVLARLGDGVGALINFQTGLAAIEEVVLANPESAVLQRDLLVSHTHVGDVLQALGKPADAW